MNENTLERIGMRRIELRKEYSVNSGLSFEEWMIERLIGVEDRAAALESFAATVAETAPNTHAVLYVESERVGYAETFWMMGREAKKLLSDVYKSIEELK